MASITNSDSTSFFPFFLITLYTELLWFFLKMAVFFFSWVLWCNWCDIYMRNVMSSEECISDVLLWTYMTSIMSCVSIYSPLLFKWVSATLFTNKCLPFKGPLVCRTLFSPSGRNWYLNFPLPPLNGFRQLCCHRCVAHLIWPFKGLLLAEPFFPSGLCCN